MLFPFATYWWLYLAFVGVVAVLLVLDLGVFNKKPHVISNREALVWTVVWILCALAFGAGLYGHILYSGNEHTAWLSLPGFSPEQTAKRIFLEYLTGYVIEKALSVDNLFVFVVVFQFFRIPMALQHRVLFYGIIGAIVFRAIFIAIGAALIQYHFVQILFGIFLIWTGFKLFFSEDDGVDPEHHWLLKWLKRHLPLKLQLEGPHFAVREGGKLFFTPLFLALIFLETTDIVFAVDSVPAIFGVTNEPFIVFTSNIFAILGLRSLYFLLANMMDQFHYLKYGLALVLCFVGVKMLGVSKHLGFEINTIGSLAFILCTLAVSVAASLLHKRAR